ncbi:MAG: hypothetical protein GX265_00910 [Mollicutes bacterium]|nr:hypothetical protein [Mollicutes bacterium]
MFKRKRLIIAILFLIILFIMTMYAGSPRQKETIATRTVKFIDSFNNSQISMQEVEIGKAASVPDAPKYTNYVFIGWYEGDSKITDFTNIIKDLTVYTKYADDINNNGIADNEDATYDVTFYDTLGRRNISTIKVLVGLNAAVPRVPTHIGYVFTGWSRSFTNIRESLTVNALFSPDTNRNNVADEKDARYTVSFTTKGNGVLTGETEFKNLLTGLNFYELVTIPKHEAGKGYTFMGWEPSLPEKDGKITSNVTYTAVFEDTTPPEVTSIKYSNDGKVTNEDIKVTITTNEEIKTPAGWTRVSTIEFTKPYAQNTTETFKVEDLAGNKSKDIKIIVTGIDKNDPEVELNMNMYNPKSFSISAKEDKVDDSGLKRVDYTLNKGESSLGTWGKDLSGNKYENLRIKSYRNDKNKTKYLISLRDGNYSLNATVKDKAGNDTEKTIEFIVDHTNPIVKVKYNNEYLFSGSYINNEEIMPKVEVVDANFDKFIVYNHKNRVIFTSEENNIEIQDLAVGSYKIKAIDKAGNDSKLFYINIDNTDPDAEIFLKVDRRIYTEDNKVFEEHVNVTGKVSNEKDIRSHNFEIINPDNTKYEINKNHTDKKSYSFDLNTSKGSGKYQIIYTATDKAGNSSSDTIILYIDKNAPTIENVEVTDYNHQDENNNYYGNSSINVKITADDNYSDTLSYKCGNDSWTESNECTVTASNGVYSIRVKDEVGNTTQTSLNIYINKELPSIDFVTTNDASYNGDYAKTLKPIYINSNKADKLLLSKYKWSNQSEYQSFNINNAISSPTSDGTYTLTIMLEDWYGNTNTITSNEFTIDNKLPLVTNKSYGPNKSTTGNVTVTITFDEDVEVENSDWSKKDNDSKVWYKTYSANATESVIYKDRANNYGNNKLIKVENIITYNVKYQEVKIPFVKYITATVTFNHYVRPDYYLALFSDWQISTDNNDCKIVYLKHYCKKWTRKYYDNITEYPIFHTLDNAVINPTVEIKGL